MLRTVFSKLRPIRGDGGQVLVLFAAGAVGFVALVGMAADVGKVVSARTDLQKVADAAAFAGAQDLPYSTSAANASASSYVTANGGSSPTISITTTSQANDTIEVRVSRAVDYAFLKLVGLNGATPGAKAKVQVQVVTGYQFDNQDIFPYAIWGGQRTAGFTNGCPYNICTGSTQVFRSNNYQNASHATGTDWAVNGNNFKGYFHHGGQVVQAGNNWQTFSSGGNAIGQEPTAALDAHLASGEPIILPVIQSATCTGGCNNIQFKIVAWVALRVTHRGNASQNWDGVIVANYATPQGFTGGSTPPSTFPVVRTARLLE